MYLPVAIHAAAIEGKYIHCFPRRGRMAWKHVNVALLAHEMNALRQQLGIA